MPPIKSIISAAALIFAAGITSADSALAQTPSTAGTPNPQIDIAYIEPTVAALRPFYERLRREEDAADQIAGFLMLQFGKEVARTAIKGTAYVWLTFSREERPAYWDVHSTAGQRFYNFLCIGYGGDPESFKEFVGKPLPKERLENCAHEYRQVRNAFIKTIMPHIDQELTKQVQARQWLRPDDGKWD